MGRSCLYCGLSLIGGEVGTDVLSLAALSGRDVCGS